jgi:hypothetical protein
MRMGGGRILAPRRAPIAVAPATLTRLLASINGFRLHCKLNAGTATLAGAVARVVGLASEVWPRSGAGLRPRRRAGTEGAAGLAELRALQDGLLAEQSLAPFELAHAMDALIIDLVRMLPLWDGSSRTRRGLRRLRVRPRREFGLQ